MIKIPNSEQEFEKISRVSGLVYVSSYASCKQLIFHNTEDPSSYWIEEIDGTIDCDELYK